MSQDSPDNDEQRLQQAQRLARLITGFLRENLTERERAELDAWVGESDENMQLFEELTDENNLQQAMALMGQWETEASTAVFKGRINFTPPAKRIHWKPWLTAAAVLIGLTIGAVWWFNGDPQPKTTLAGKGNGVTVADIQPGTAKAILITAGKRVPLSAMGDSVIDIRQGLRVTNQNNILQYTTGSVGDHRDPAPENNTLQTPAGGEYQLVLADGTKVWLNAASSITYPTAFTGVARTVELSGEAYFEVAKQSVPFIVHLGETAVKVLGTHFNIDHYPENTAIKTTLLEGSVEIYQRGAGKRLRPGEQAISTFEGVRILHDIETEDIVAWKNGLFAFREDSIGAVMNQLARWYQVEVVYQGSVRERFTGRIKRNSTLSQALHILELIGRVRFTVVGKKVLVQP